MTKEDWKKLDVQTYGLSPDLCVPIAARDIPTIEKYVGTVTKIIHGRKRPINGFVVEIHRPIKNSSIPLWDQDESELYYSRLHPARQLWVHVDYTGYRNAWKRLGFGHLTSDVFLDHIYNRNVVRNHSNNRPFLRLCPVSRKTNTNSGLNKGLEGMQKASLNNLENEPIKVQQRTRKCLDAPVVLADPFDLTKMLDIPPGLFEMQGTARMLKNFYKKEDYYNSK